MYRLETIKVLGVKKCLPRKNTQIFKKCYFRFCIPHYTLYSFVLNTKLLLLETDQLYKILCKGNKYLLSYFARYTIISHGEVQHVVYVNLNEICVLWT
jgi:hypothetical protein